jgi:hypothetical protein
LFLKLKEWSVNTTLLKGIGVQIKVSPFATRVRGLYYDNVWIRVGRMRERSHFDAFIIMTLPAKHIAKDGFASENASDIIRGVWLHELGHRQDYLDHLRRGGHSRIMKERMAEHYKDTWLAAQKEARATCSNSGS